MAIKGRDREFRIKKLSYVDFKPLNMDRVLTMLFPRLRFGGYGTRRPPRRSTNSPIGDFVRRIHQGPERMFVGFDEHPDVVERWIETDLMDMVNRGKPNQALSCAASPARQHLQVPQRSTRKGLRRGRAALLDALPRRARGRGQAVRDALTPLLLCRAWTCTPISYDSSAHSRC